MNQALRVPWGMEPTTLRAVMAALRKPETGCPWDLKQNHQSLARYLREEAAEVLDALAATDCITTQSYQYNADVAALGPNGAQYFSASTTMDLIRFARITDPRPVRPACLVRQTPLVPSWAGLVTSK